MKTFPISLPESDRLTRCPKHLAVSRDARPCERVVWDEIRRDYSPKRVFVNVPYEESYRPMLATIVATLKKVGLTPMLALTRSEGQPYRICKICAMMQKSKYCISDLSAVHLHNIPFELGFFTALGRISHSFVLVDKKFVEHDGVKVRKFDAHISNLKGVEVIVHGNDPATLVKGLLHRMESDVAELQEGLSLQLSRSSLTREILKVAQTRVLDAIRAGTLDQYLAASATVVSKVA